METIFTNIKERILQFTDIKGFAKENFFNELGVTYGNFKGQAKEKALSSDILAKIVTKYPEINTDWLLTGKGEILKKNNAKDNEVEKVLSKSDILNHIMKYLGMEDDQQLAKSLGITEALIKNWRKKNTFDIEIIYEKFPFFNLYWLIDGKGEMIEGDGIRTILEDIQLLKTRQRALIELLTTVFSPEEIEEREKNSRISNKIQELLI